MNTTILYQCNNCNWKYTTNKDHICDICKLPYHVVCENWLNKKENNK